MEMPRVAASASWWSPAIAGGFAIETNVWRRFGFTVESTVLVRRRLALALSDHAPALVSLGRLSYLQQVYLWFALP
jgi:hypothetical protein